MERGILSTVIEVEREIQKSLEAEKTKAQGWIEKGKSEAEDEIAGEELRLREAFDRMREGARADAERKASAIIAEATSLSLRLKGISDETFKEVIARHIVKILPGH